jgi:hypothetical protein
MRKFLTFLIALGAVAFGVCSPASAQCNNMTGVIMCRHSVPPPPPGPAYIWRGGIAPDTSSITTTYTFPMNIGTSAAVVAVFIASNNNSIINSGSLIHLDHLCR